MYNIELIVREVLYFPLRAHSHASRLALQTACFLVLLVGYAVERLACSAGLPKDCLATVIPCPHAFYERINNTRVSNSNLSNAQPAQLPFKKKSPLFSLNSFTMQINYYEFFSDVTSLLLYGLALGWFIGISEHSRFSWLFHPRRWYAGMTFLLTPPVYSAISNIDELKFDLTDFSKWSAPFIGLWAIAMGAIAAVICWHILAAWRRAGPASFAVYIITRLVMLGWFAASAFIISNSGSPMKIHLHHLYIGWALAIWADLNHPVSAVTVAVGAGIFVQGVGAYSFAPIFTPHGCFETPATASIKCKFWAEKPFTLQVCGTAGDIAHHKCT